MCPQMCVQRTQMPPPFQMNRQNYRQNHKQSNWGSAKCLLPFHGGAKELNLHLFKNHVSAWKHDWIKSQSKCQVTQETRQNIYTSLANRKHNIYTATYLILQALNVTKNLQFPTISVLYSTSTGLKFYWHSNISVAILHSDCFTVLQLGLSVKYGWRISMIIGDKFTEKSTKVQKTLRHFRDTDFDQCLHSLVYLWQNVYWHYCKSFILETFSLRFFHSFHHFPHK